MSSPLSNVALYNRPQSSAGQEPRWPAYSSPELERQQRVDRKERSRVTFWRPKRRSRSPSPAPAAAPAAASPAPAEAGPHRKRPTTSPDTLPRVAAPRSASDRNATALLDSSFGLGSEGSRDDAPEDLFDQSVATAMALEGERPASRARILPKLHECELLLHEIRAVGGKQPTVARSERVMALFDAVVRFPSPVQHIMRQLRDQVYTMVYSGTAFTSADSTASSSGDAGPSYKRLPYFAESQSLLEEKEMLLKEMKTLQDTVTERLEAQHTQRVQKLRDEIESLTRIKVSQANVIARHQSLELAAQGTVAELQERLRVAHEENAELLAITDNKDLFVLQEQLAVARVDRRTAIEAKEQVLADLDAARDEIAELRENQEDSVPAKEHDALKDEITDLEAQVAKLNNTQHRYKDVYAKLKSSYEAIKQDMRRKDAERASLTPRPQWDMLPEDILQGIDDVAVSNSGHTSPVSSARRGLGSTRVKLERLVELCRVLNQQVSDMSQELGMLRDEMGADGGGTHGSSGPGGAKDAGAASAGGGKHRGSKGDREDAREHDYFTALGTGDNVPKYLHFSGRVRNRHMSRSYALTIVRDVWKQYLATGGRAKIRKPLEDFFVEYLRKRFGLPGTVAEWGYNIHHTMQQNSKLSADCSIFIKVLHGEFSDKLYTEDEENLDRVMRLARKMGEELGRGVSKVPKKEFLAAIKRMYPSKPLAEHYALKISLSRVGTGKLVEFHRLFGDDAQGQRFVQTLREQYIRLLERQTALIAEAVQQHVQGGEGGKKTDLTFEAFARIVRETGSSTTEHEIIEALTRFLGRPVEKLDGSRIDRLPEFILHGLRMTVWRPRLPAEFATMPPLPTNAIPAATGPSSGRSRSSTLGRAGTAGSVGGSLASPASTQGGVSSRSRSRSKSRGR